VLRTASEHRGHEALSACSPHILWADVLEASLLIYAKRVIAERGIDPRDTRAVLSRALAACANAPLERIVYGVFRM
jgi:hypothetical protein